MLEDMLDINFKKGHRWWSWRYLRWLTLFPATLIALLIGIIFGEFALYFLQFPYFHFLDLAQRHQSPLGRRFAAYSLGTLPGILVMSVLIWIALVVISKGCRQRTALFAKCASAILCVCCLVTLAGAYIGSPRDRKIPFIAPTWTVDFAPTFVIQPYRHITEKMVFPDVNHLAIISAGQVNVLDTESRKITATQWVEGWNPHLFASRSGKLIVSTSGLLEKFSVNLQPIGKALSLAGGFADVASPSGARIAWQHYKGPPKVTLIDTETLQAAETFTYCNASAITDHSVAELVNIDQGNEEAINVCDPGSADHILLHAPIGMIGNFYYLNDQTILLVNGFELTLLDSSGKVLATDHWDQNCDFAGASKDGTRFAIAIERWGWGDPAEINKVTIIVYDTASFRPIAQVRSKQQWVSVFAPDGHAIATSSGTSTNYFRLP